MKMMHQTTGGTPILKFSLLAMFAVVLPGAERQSQGQISGQDPRIGLWTLVSALSSLDPPDKLSITDVKGTVHVLMSGETHLDFTVKSGGPEMPVPGNPGFNQVELRRLDKRNSEVQEKKDGLVVATVREKLSSSGNELTVVTSREGHPDQVTVWTRSGAKTGGDAFAGDWVEDPSKTRLRQGLALKFEPSGSGGVRFSGDFSYDARFDGKPYDLRNSRNDTVALQLVDPHTVDAVYRRGDQVTQKDRWQVSADGQQMTVSTTGTLETGQQLTEKLAFKKQ